MHRQDGRQEIDRRTLLAKGAASAALLVTGCARKESRGFAATSLRQLRARLERHIGPGFAPGMVGLVASGPEVETFVLGKMAFDGPDMRRDTIFRIASMTKPATRRANLSTAGHEGHGVLRAAGQDRTVAARLSQRRR